MQYKQNVPLEFLQKWGKEIKPIGIAICLVLEQNKGKDLFYKDITALTGSSERSVLRAIPKLYKHELAVPSARSGIHTDSGYVYLPQAAPPELGRASVENPRVSTT